MNAAMIYLNPNVTKEEADRMFNESMKKREELVDKLFKNAEELPEGRRIEYITSCLPLITMF